VPTTPNPTGGYLLLVPEEKVTKLNMSVGDGIKYIISLGSIAPEKPFALRANGQSGEAQPEAIHVEKS
jgi:uncharacterized membrane protein